MPPKIHGINIEVEIRYPACALTGCPDIIDVKIDAPFGKFKPVFIGDEGELVELEEDNDWINFQSIASKTLDNEEYDKLIAYIVFNVYDCVIDQIRQSYTRLTKPLEAHDGNSYEFNMNSYGTNGPGWYISQYKNYEAVGAEQYYPSLALAIQAVRRQIEGGDFYYH